MKLEWTKTEGPFPVENILCEYNARMSDGTALVIRGIRRITDSGFAGWMGFVKAPRSMAREVYLSPAECGSLDWEKALEAMEREAGVREAPHMPRNEPKAPKEGLAYCIFSSEGGPLEWTINYWRGACIREFVFARKAKTEIEVPISKLWAKARAEGFTCRRVRIVPEDKP
jgi:hypothetical protein